MNLRLAFDENQVIFFTEQVERDQAIEQLCHLLEEKGYVKPSFLQAVIEREKIFPTGLPTEPYGVAIPHTDSIHVNKGSIAAGVLSTPIEFVEMGTDDSTVQISLILVLAIDDKRKMVRVLQTLAEEFRDRKFIEDLIGSKCALEFVQQFNHRSQRVHPG